jgi:SAM-dependent methyltransferase
VLNVSEVKAYYDRLGRWLDSQGFYENPAVDDLVAHARFRDAQRVFEFGCGTGKFAARLLGECLPPSATYTGCDVSPVMVGLASRRLQAYPRRAKVLRTDGTVAFPLPDRSADRIVSTYVLDLLSEGDTRAFFAEAHRVLAPGGMLCLASLTEGVGPLSRAVSLLWAALFRLRPSVVGGCRPVRLDAYADRKHWRSAHRNIVTPFGVPSEVLILVAV